MKKDSHVHDVPRYVPRYAAISIKSIYKREDQILRHKKVQLPRWAQHIEPGEVSPAAKEIQKADSVTIPVSLSL